jgi:PAS domain S-box-containing protein
MRKLKPLLSSVVYASPKLMGWSAFLILLVLTVFVSLSEYRLKIASEREIVHLKLNEFKSLLTEALNEGISAAKTLGYIAQNQEITREGFESIAQQILDSNPHVDVLQFLEGGKIVAVYPLAGNESVIGYDVLSHPDTKVEIEEAIRRKGIYFSGPLRLKQGGWGIVGRYPLFKEGKFVGSSAVLFYFDHLLEVASLQSPENSPFAFQFSKTDPNTGILQNFIPEDEPEQYSGYEASTFLEIGNWKLSVQLKESTAARALIGKILISLFTSALLGFLIWNFARQPSLLSQKVEAQSKELLQANERFELASRATSDVIWDWDLVSDEVYRSDHFFDILGYDKSDITGTNEFWKSIIHPDDVEPVTERMSAILEGTDQYWAQEFRVKKRDGSFAYIVDRGFILRNPEGKAVRMIGAIQDITTRKAAELELVELNQRLTRANEELKIFASVASHDLREPLRMISSFLALLEKKYGDSLDEKAHQYISFAIDGAKRLTALINDLLEYSRVGFDPALIEEIDTNELVNGVVKLNSNLLRENDAVLTIEDLPTIRGIKIPLQLVFQNLIGNALKYRQDDLAPQIRISGRELEDFWEFSVSDNGIGIESDYLEFIFGLSKRVNLKYPGSGMGLATCKKIITQHGGRIWAESNPGKGSIFYFTIKKDD